MNAAHGASAPLLRPKIVRLGPNLCGAAFSLMKIVPAHHILRAALREGRIGPETTIVESTSGTFGLALAIEAALIGRPLVLVSDPAMDPRLLRRVRDLGARVEICDTPSALGEYQSVRLEALARIREEISDHFWPCQYDNYLNPDSYAGAADDIRSEIGEIDALVGPVGSGGSMSGLVRRIREFSDIEAVAVDTPGSILFGCPDRERELRGLGNSIMPRNLDHALFDSVHWCGAGIAYRATRQLHRRHTVFQGPTSGAAYLVARWMSAQSPDRIFVAIMPDDGTRYLDTVYDDAWLAGHRYQREVADAALARGPQLVSGPEYAEGDWSMYPWARRSLADVAAQSTMTAV